MSNASVNNAKRSFEDRPATRERTPLFVGLIGPSGSGKTYSALRLATGIQRIAGGDIHVIDTEARRSLHYAERFKFRHVSMGQPFSPLDYLAAIDHCVSKGAKTIIIDSMSHEHEGPGGVLEMHEAEVTRMAGNDYGKRERVKMLGWAKPKAARRRLINSLLQIDCNFLFCFRAKQKLRIVPGQEPVNLGWLPIAGDDFVYELTLKCLLLPGANGYPTLSSEFEGEKLMIKTPEQFRGVVKGDVQLNEDLGASLATWAAGTAAPQKLSADDLLRGYAACSDGATWRSLEGSRALVWGSVSKAVREQIKDASDGAQKRIADASRIPEPQPDLGSQPETPTPQRQDDGRADDAAEAALAARDREKRAPANDAGLTRRAVRDPAHNAEDWLDMLGEAPDPAAICDLWAKYVFAFNTACVVPARRKVALEALIALGVTNADAMLDNASRGPRR